jgi:hypothetical protein
VQNRALDRDSFADYLRKQWGPSGIEVGEFTQAPYQEMVKAAGGWSFGASVHRDGAKARVGVWFRPAPGGLADLAALRNHYQQTLQRQNRFVRILNCATELGSFFLFWETTQSMTQDAWQPWVQMVEELSGLCFQGEALDEFLESFR